MKRKKSISQLTTIFIIRHGETEWNVQKIMQGHSNSPLTPEGERQAGQIANDLKPVHFDAVFSSDMLRAKRTAEIIALERKIAVKTTEALRERSYGVFEGKVYDEYNQALQKLIAKYKTRAEQDLAFQKMHGVETTNQSIARFITFLREIAVSYSGQTILVVSHGGVMRYFLIHLGVGTNETLPSGSIANTAYIKLESDGVDFFVKETKGINKQKTAGSLI